MYRVFVRTWNLEGYIRVAWASQVLDVLEEDHIWNNDLGMNKE
jgi:hypothetical protein